MCHRTFLSLVFFHSQSPYGNSQLTNEKGEKQKGAEAWPMQELTTQREGCPPSQCTVKVTGLSEDISEDLLIMYFENTKRSKGGPVNSIDIDRDLRECLITFESPEGMFKALKQKMKKSLK